MECRAQVALYGHTHRAQVDLERGMYLVNPGAVCDRLGGGVAYADIRVADERRRARQPLQMGIASGEVRPAWAAFLFCRRCAPRQRETLPAARKKFSAPIDRRLCFVLFFQSETRLKK